MLAMRMYSTLHLECMSMSINSPTGLYVNLLPMLNANYFGPYLSIHYWSCFSKFPSHLHLAHTLLLHAYFCSFASLLTSYILKRRCK